ncbi:hypothetical protein H072_7802 [Dactylellina haptotyla CBS 200.50]|uniref:Uncharacterized protein n=1 Tax=Dactylellina haptotyla (strain CBS 200.50) TaxID=1284197 RepID=S8BTA9_DACHA|nr:hypothetical protein H072_7802 [Dactylellina haptotyla CBS 200.50]
MASNMSSTSLSPLPAAVASTLSSLKTTIQLINTPSKDPSITASKTYTSVALYAFLTDFANLTKAYATRLGLVTNPPIADSTYPAIARILVDVQNSVLPVASSAPYIASKERYGSTMHTAVVNGVVDLLKGIEEMVKGVQSNISGDAASESQNSDKGKKRQEINITDLRQALPSITKSPYTSTGQIWSSADHLLSISQKHLIGLVESKLQSHADMLNDCIAEFKEWVSDAAEELNGEDSGFDEDESQSDSAHAGLVDEDDFFGLEGDNAKVTKEVLTAAEATQKKLKLTSMLYAAAMKRRVKDPSTRLGGVFTSQVTEDGNEYSVEKERNTDRLGQIVEISKLLAEKADNLAAAFYDGEDIGVIIDLREEFVRHAVNLAEVCKLNSEGGDDTPSAWFGKFLENEYRGPTITVSPLATLRKLGRFVR